MLWTPALPCLFLVLDRTAAEAADGHIIGQDGSPALIAGHRIGTGLLLPAASSIAAITKSVAV
jgi:hypothetical protein